MKKILILDPNNNSLTAKLLYEKIISKNDELKIELSEDSYTRENRVRSMIHRAYTDIKTGQLLAANNQEKIQQAWDNYHNSKSSILCYDDHLSYLKRFDEVFILGEDVLSNFQYRSIMASVDEEMINIYPSDKSIKFFDVVILYPNKNIATIKTIKWYNKTMKLKLLEKYKKRGNHDK